jgi:hypothetical protein
VFFHVSYTTLDSGVGQKSSPMTFLPEQYEEV